MAEFAFEMQERMLPEYEQIKQYQLLTDEQLKELIRKRKSFSLKIMQMGKSVASYMEFIYYEIKLHNLIVEKEKSLNINLVKLKSSLAKRIVNLYYEALRKFSYDEGLWMHFIDFCKRNLNAEVSGIYERALRYHGDKPRYWYEAALWAYEFSGNINRATDIFLRALQRHPTSGSLYKGFFSILLQRAVKMSAVQNLAENSISEQELGLEKAKSVYTESKKNVENVEYFLKLLENCEEPQYMDITAELQLMIIKDMKKKFVNSEEFWHALAQRELRGFNMEDLENRIEQELDVMQIDSLATVDIKPELKTIWKKRSIRDRINLCCAAYKSAVHKLNTTRMWNFYINAMLELNLDMSSAARFKRRCLSAAFRDGHDAGRMSIHHYRALVNMLMLSSNGVESAANIVTTALNRHENIEFCILLIDIYIADNNEKKMTELFSMVMEKYNAVDTFPIWKQIISYYKMDASKAKSKLNDIYEKAILQTSENFTPLRCEYLKFCHENGGIKAARKAYAKLVQLPPHNLELHEKMIELEASSMTHDDDKRHWRQCYEYMTFFFGSKIPSVWLDYIRFERDHGNCAHISKLHERAKFALKAEHVDQFLSSYALEHNLNAQQMVLQKVY